MFIAVPYHSRWMLFPSSSFHIFAAGAAADAAVGLAAALLLISLAASCGNVCVHVLWPVVHAACTVSACMIAA
jgi:hypothetical protein